MKTLVIPDVHNKIHKVDQILADTQELQPDEIVFLGDYFDSYHDHPFDALKTATWLKSSLAFPNRIHLIGNHDAPYIAPGNSSLWCPGYSTDKLKVIRSTLPDEYFDRLQPAHYSNSFLFSHAGAHPDLIACPVQGLFTPAQLVEKVQDAWNRVKAGEEHPYFLPGARMGEDRIGGITWVHWHGEFKHYPGINQIVGHTNVDSPRLIGENETIDINLDTHLEYVLLITDGVVEFIKTE